MAGGAGDEEGEEKRSAGIAEDCGAGDVDVGRCEAGARPVLPNKPMISSIPPLGGGAAVPLLAAGTPVPKMSARRSVVALDLLLPN